MVKKTFKGIGFGLIAIISVLLIGVSIGVYLYSDTIKKAAPAMLAVKTDQAKADTEDILGQGQDLATQIESEGIVLLNNQDDLLPLSEDIKDVNVFGWGASQWVSGGSGSGEVKDLDIDFLDALDDYGISYNEDLIGMYEDFHGERPYETLHAHDHEAYRLYEPSIHDENYYSKEMLEEAEAYSDTAFFVISRFAGESSDASKEQYKLTEKGGDIVTDDSRTFLDLSAEEEETLTYLGESYDNVVVVVNSANTMALGELETIPGVDATLLVGVTGTAAADAIPEVLYGDLSPSGKTVDTYAYDLSMNASFANSGLDGIGAYPNAKGLYPYDGKTVNGNTGESDSLYDQVSYLDYVEGIYVGYRWFETADTEGYWDDVSNEYGEGYDGIVQYPFGYGLSYTDFEWEVTSFSPSSSEELSKDETITAQVEVTNTGDYADKDVVQMYYTPPYKDGEIEKASVNLADFAKTKELQPGESDIVDLSFNVRDMASYDDYDANDNGFIGYELDPGDYEIKLMKNAHEEVNADDTKMTYELSENIQYPTDEVTGEEINNQFIGEDVVDGVSIDGEDSDGDIQYMTRADFQGTFPKENVESREMTDNVKELNLYTKEMAEEWAEEKEVDEVTFEEDSHLQVYEDNQVTDLGLELGKDYDDSRWEELLDQMSKEEMENLVLHGYVHNEEVQSIGKPLLADLDGPSQMNSFNVGASGTGFPNATVMAQTWNKDLAQQMGTQAAKEAGSIGISGWYAPGVNIHRSPFGGRNYEYYSEDPFLSGVFAAEVIESAKNGGLYTFLKHFILYEQESNRDSIYTWLTEQSLREVYLKPFQYAIQEGGSTGLMSSYGRLGAVWAGGSEALLTNILRDEWGFEGMVITDYSDHHEFMNMDQSLRHGGDLWMDGIFDNGEFIGETESNRFNYELRRASKNVLYTWLNAMYTNHEYNESTDTPIEQPTIKQRFPYLIVIAIAIDILVIGGWTYWGVRRRKRKKLG